MLKNYGRAKVKRFHLPINNRLFKHFTWYVVIPHISGDGMEARYLHKDGVPHGNMGNPSNWQYLRTREEARQLAREYNKKFGFYKGCS